MKRAPSEDLFRLIRSLSKGEKRNFKLLAGLLASEKDKKYIELFEVIEKQESCDEARVLKQMRDLYGVQLSVGKHYLYRLILRSLAYFRNNPSTELASLLDQARVLKEKDLYPQASKLLRKGLQEVVFIEDFATHYAMLGLQLELLLRMQTDKDLTERAAEIEAQRADVLSKMANLDAYRALDIQLFVLDRTGVGAYSQPFLTLKANPLLSDPAHAQSVRARIGYHSLHRRFCSLEGDLKGALAHSEQLLEIYEAWPLLKADAIQDYFQELNKFCIILLRLGRVEAAFSKMEEFRLFRHDYPKARVDFFQWYYVLVLAAGIHVGDPSRVDVIEKELKNEWTDIEGKLPKSKEMWYRYLMAYSHFMLGRSRAALHWINLLLAEPRSDIRINVQCSARLLNLMVHFQLGNYFLVESEVVNTRRFMERHNQCNDFERQALRCMKALCNAADGPQLRQTIEGWLQRMRRAEDSASGQLPQMLDICTWLESQLHGHSMADFRKQRVNLSELAAFQV
jgi:hypothetical protein